MSLTLDDHKDSGGHEIFWDTLSFSYGSSAFNATHSNVALISCHKATEKVVAIYPSILKVWTIRIQKISPQYLKPLKENIKLNAITITIYWTHNPHNSKRCSVLQVEMLRYSQNVNVSYLLTVAGSWITFGFNFVLVFICQFFYKKHFPYIKKN